MTKLLSQTTGASPKADSNFLFSTGIVVMFLTVIGAILRVIFIAKESLWLDEATASWFASGPLERALKAESTNPPLYYLILHFWIKIFGTSEVALRSLSVIPSVMTIPLFFSFARRLISERGALLATAILAFSPFHIAYAQEARTFALLACLLLLSSSSCFVTLSSKEPLRSKGEILPYIVWTVAALYAHFISIFFLFAQNLYFALRFVVSKRDRDLTLFWPWVRLQLVILCLYLPWLIKMFAAVRGEGQVRRHLLLKIPQTFFSFLFGDTLIPLDEVAVKNIIPTLLDNWGLLMAAGVGVLIVALSISRRRADYHRALGFLSVMVLATLISSFCVSIKIAFFDERYLIGVSLFLYILCGWGVDVLLDDVSGKVRLSRTRLALGMIIPAFLILLSLANYFFNPRFGKEQWREVVGELEPKIGDDDLVVLDQDFLLPAYNYYSTKSVAIIQLTPEARDKNGTAWKQIAAQLDARQSFWLIRSHFSDDLFLERIGSSFQIRDEHWYRKDKGIWVYRMEKK